MRYLSYLLILLALIGCTETKTDLSGNTPLKINDFNKAFKNIELQIRKIHEKSKSHDRHTIRTMPLAD